MRKLLQKFSPVVLIGTVLTAACLVLYAFEPRFIGALSLFSYDVFMRLTQKPPQTDTVLLVDIDEESLAQHGQWPWPRDVVAEMTRRIVDGGALAVAFDVVFSEPDGKSPAAMESMMSNRYSVAVDMASVPDRLEDFDRLFAETLRDCDGRVVLGCFMQQDRDNMPVADDRMIDDDSYRGFIFEMPIDTTNSAAPFLKQAKDITISIPELRNAAALNAFINADPDDDSVMRRVPLIYAYGSRRYPSLALGAIKVAFGIEQVVAGYTDQGIEGVQVEDLVIPTDMHSAMMVNFRQIATRTGQGGFFSFPTLSAGDVVTGDYDPGVFEGKIVFVGASAAGLRDLRATPITGEFAGMEVHATVVDNLLAGDILRRPVWSYGADVAAILFVGIFLTVLIHRGRAFLSFFVTTLIALASILISYRLFSVHHLVILPTWPVLAVVMIYPVLTMIKYWQEEMQKRQVRKMFGTMVSPEVLRYMENNPGSFSLSGQRTEATMFFSDVAGFTTISEQLEPDRLAELLNRYLSPMTQTVLDSGGYVDKYEGDAIMAEWNVPFSVDGHALVACGAALDQQERLRELRPELKAEFGHNIHVRMGLNTGVIVAGNMGSDRRFEYTVMGDAVNLAARLEPANKDYGTEIMIGEETFAQCGDELHVRLLDKIVLKGKVQPVQVYELIARKGSAPDSMLEVVELYESALRLHWERQWEKALACLERALAIEKADTPCLRLSERINAYRSIPPGQEWMGEYVRASKD